MSIPTHSSDNVNVEMEDTINRNMYSEKTRNRQVQMIHDELELSSLFTQRRPRAETMPTHYVSNIDSSVVDHSRVDNNTPNVDTRNDISAVHSFGSGIFNHWMNDMHISTPTTEQLLTCDDNTIASTFASLGLDDDRPEHLVNINTYHNNHNKYSTHPNRSFTSIRSHVDNNHDWNNNDNNPIIRHDNIYSSSLKILGTHGRPRALSAVDDRVIQEDYTQLNEGLWNTESSKHHHAILHQKNNDQHKSFLRTSHSSADLLESISRQRKNTSIAPSPKASNKPSINYDYIQSIDTWSGDNRSFNTGSVSSSAEQSSIVDMEGDYHSTLHPSSKSLWIGQLDPSITTGELHSTFSRFGIIESINHFTDRESVLINFSTVEETLKAKEYLMNQMNSLFDRSYNKTQDVTAIYSMEPSTPTVDSNTQGPTRALWIGNIPTHTTQIALASLFSPFGTIESIRILTHKNCAFINFYLQEDAINAKKSVHNVDILGPGSESVKIGFAKVPPLKTNAAHYSDQFMMDEPGKHQRHQSKPDEEIQPPKSRSKQIPIHKKPLKQPHSKQPGYSIWPNQTDPVESTKYQQMMYMMNGMIYHPSMFTSLVSERKSIIEEFGESESDGPLLDILRLPQTYYHSIPAAPELGQTRKVDISRLRDIRKRLDSGHVPNKELETIAVECIDELVELCSDHIGNTVIQRLFERCSELTRSMMLEAVGPYLASIGVHKNGTWAAQKIIDTAKLPAHIHLVCRHLQPYVPALLLDQFGNYVVQCCLGLGPTRNQFIFDAIVDSCWEIAQGRFGARAVRATLESPHVTKRQQKYVAASVVQHALLLATNANGALLLIWLLDTSGIPGRYRVLAPRLLPHLAQLCTHKLASLTVLKLINQRQEPDARSLILNALFFDPLDPTVIEEILYDQVHGVSLVQKVLSSSYIDLKDRQKIAEGVKHLLNKLKLHHIQGYKRLVEEINMVMVDSAPGPSLGSLSTITSQLSMSSELAAALHAKYLSTATYEPQEKNDNGFYGQPTNMMANLYAAAAAAAAAVSANNQSNASSPQSIKTSPQSKETVSNFSVDGLDNTN
ncbi:hypothetical protein BDB01DRAFT_779383 [Pilobolus umbonatus]|nr:hypothetical protein BDB01DRAFT_779383 [Pilobolus umbonatus]